MISVWFLIGVGVGVVIEALLMRGDRPKVRPLQAGTELAGHYQWY